MVTLHEAIHGASVMLQERRLGLNDLCSALDVPSSRCEGVRRHGSLGTLLGVLPIQSQGSLFDVVEGGRLSVILAAYSWPGNWPIDLVAFRMDKPSEAYRLLGVADALGDVSIARARYESCSQLKSRAATLIVHASALDWLRSGCEGCVILNSKRVPSILADIDQCSTPSHHVPSLGKLLRQRSPHLPRIMVSNSGGIAA